MIVSYIASYFQGELPTTGYPEPDIEAPPPTPEPPPRTVQEAPDFMLCSRALVRRERVLLTDPMVDELGNSYQKPASGVAPALAPPEHVATHRANLALRDGIAAWTDGANLAALEDVLTCSVSQDTLVDPVMSTTGKSVEREYMHGWLQTEHVVPATGARMRRFCDPIVSDEPILLHDGQLISNHAVRAMARWARGEDPNVPFEAPPLPVEPPTTRALEVVVADAPDRRIARRQRIFEAVGLHLGLAAPLIGGIVAEQHGHGWVTWLSPLTAITMGKLGAMLHECV